MFYIQNARLPVWIPDKTRERTSSEISEDALEKIDTESGTWLPTQLDKASFSCEVKKIGGVE